MNIGVRNLLAGAVLALLPTAAVVAWAQGPHAMHTAAGTATRVASGPAAPAYSRIYSKQTYVLARGAAVYNAWKAWIEHQNAESAHRYSLRNDRAAPALNGSGGIGQITITVRSALSPDSVQSAATPSILRDNGPPAGLPSTGISGQHVTVVNQTSTVYQSWTNEWQAGTAGGSGSWVNISYGAYACASGSMNLCTRQSS